VNSVEVFPTVLNCSKQSGVIGNKSQSCEDVTRYSKVVWWSFGSREHSRLPNDILTPFRRLLLHNDHSRPLHASTTTVDHRKMREEGGNGHYEVGSCPVLSRLKSGRQWSVTLRSWEDGTPTRLSVTGAIIDIFSFHTIITVGNGDIFYHLLLKAKTFAVNR